MKLNRHVSPRRAAAIVAASIIAGVLTVPTVSGAQSPTTTTIPATTILEPEPEPEPELEAEPEPEPEPGDTLPDAGAADADAVAGQPTFTG